MVIDYQFNVLSGEIDFNTDDLLRDAIGQQVRTESIEIVDVRLSEKYQDIGVIKQRGNGDYFVELSADIDPYALEAMSMDTAFMIGRPRWKFSRNSGTCLNPTCPPR